MHQDHAACRCKASVSPGCCLVVVDELDEPSQVEVRHADRPDQAPAGAGRSWRVSGVDRAGRRLNCEYLIENVRFLYR